MMTFHLHCMSQVQDSVILTDLWSCLMTRNTCLHLKCPFKNLNLFVESSYATYGITRTILKILRRFILYKQKYAHNGDKDCGDKERNQYILRTSVDKTRLLYTIFFSPPTTLNCGYCIFHLMLVIMRLSDLKLPWLRSHSKLVFISQGSLGSCCSKK